MVTDTSSSQVEESASAPEVNTSVEVVDEPLIPADFDDRFDTAEAGVDTEESTGAEVSEENGAVETTETTTDVTESETTEPTEETEVAEPAAEVTEEVEAETPAERTYSQAEVSKIESSKDSEIATIRKEVDELRQQYDARAIESVAQGYQQGVEQQLIDAGVDGNFAKSAAEEITLAKRQAFGLSQELERVKAQLAEAETGQQQTAAHALASRLATEHNVPADKMHFLAMAPDATRMEALAREFGAAEQLKTETKTARLAEVPSGGEANQLDSGTGGSGTETDSQWLDKYNAGLYDSPADDLRASKILASRGINLQFR